MRRLLGPCAAAAALSVPAVAQSVVLFGQTYSLQRFDYRQSIRWTNPVAPFNDMGLIRVEGAWHVGDGRMYVVTSHQDQAVPTTYANFVLEIATDFDADGRVVGLSYVRTVLENNPALLASTYDLRGEGLAVNPTAIGIGATGGLLVADNASPDLLRAFDPATGAPMPYGPGGLGLPMSPLVTEFTDVCLQAEGPAADHRFYVLDEFGLRVRSFLLDGTASSDFAIGGAADPAAAPGDPKALAWLSESTAWPSSFHGHGGVLLVGLGDLRSGLQAFTRGGTQIAFEPIDNTTFPTSGPSVQPKIEAIASDSSTGRLWLFMEKGSLVDDWVYVLTPDCDGDLVADAREISSGADHDRDGNGVPDGCEPTGVAFCFGDGTGAACPCGNSSAPGSGAGCANSLGAGARLSAVGTATLTSDTLILCGDAMPNSNALYLQGTATLNGGAGAAFGDGLRCAGGSLVRLGTVLNVAGSSGSPAPGGTSVSVVGGVTSPGDRHYQVWYRNAAAFCTASTFNLSNGLTITWGP